MIEIIAGTNRPNSRTLSVARHIETLYQNLKVEAQVLDLRELNLNEAQDGDYTKGASGTWARAGERILKSEGIVVVVPEYNGSYPGILKLFIDYWKYPDAFEHRPVAFVGLGYRWGGLRPVEHLQQVFGYRNAYTFPQRVFIQNIGESWGADEKPKSPQLAQLLAQQATDFSRFVKALKSERLAK